MKLSQKLTFGLTKFSLSDFLVLLFLLGITLIFCRPLLANLDSLGRGDWDYFLFIHEVPQISILSYQQFPLWNPYDGGGLTLVGNPQNRYLSPSVIFSLFFGVVRGLKIEIVFHYFIGLGGMFLLGRSFAMGRMAALFSGIIFILSGPLTCHIAEGHMVWLPAVYFPFVFLFFRGALNESRAARKNIWLCALFLSLMFYEGATYVLNFFLIFLGIYAIFRAVQLKKVFPLWRLGFLLGAFFLLTGPKLFPVLEAIHRYPRPTPVGGLLPVDYLFSIFLDRNQSLYRLYEPIPSMGWWEVGSYLGWLPCILYFLSFTLWRTQWPLIVSSLILFLVGLGNFSDFAPWTILHRLPVFQNMWVPERIFIVFNFLLALLAGLYWQTLAQKWRQKERPFRVVLLFLIIGLTTFDFITVNSRVLKEASRPFKFDSARQIKLLGPHRYTESAFHQIHMSRQEQFRSGAWSALHPALLKNLGVINGYEALPIDHHALAVKDHHYRGEFYLLHGQGNISLVKWSPGVMTFRAHLRTKDVLVINQNFDAGWRSVRGKPAVSLQGLLSLPLDPQYRLITLYYLPFSFLLGIGALIIGVLIALLAGKFLNGKTDEHTRRAH